MYFSMSFKEVSKFMMDITLAGVVVTFCATMVKVIGEEHRMRCQQFLATSSSSSSSSIFANSMFRPGAFSSVPRNGISTGIPSGTVRGPVEDARWRKTLQRKKHAPTRKIYDLRWELCAEKIDMNTAKSLLYILPNTDFEHKFNSLASQSSHIYHIYNEHRDFSNLPAEFIAFRHPYRPWIAYYVVYPFDASSQNFSTASTENEFWSTMDLDLLLEHRYSRYVAARTINKSLHLRNWLEKPITNDGEKGIEARLAWRDITAYEQSQRGNSPCVMRFAHQACSA
jgi:hypothetical protein